MPLIYVTGLSGSGKSAVLRELGNRGYQALGVDEHGYGDWVHRRTGETIEFPHAAKDLDIRQWYEHHTWVLSEARIAGLRRTSDEERLLMFLCGVASGDDQVWDYFDKVIALVIDTDTMKQRIASRADNQFGKTEAEMDEILSWHKTYERDYRRRGAEIVDAAKPLDIVVDEVIGRSAS